MERLGETKDSARSEQDAAVTPTNQKALNSHISTYLELKREYDEAKTKLLALKKEFWESTSEKGRNMISELEGSLKLCIAAMQGAKSEIDMAQQWEYYSIDEESAGEAVLLVLQTLEVMVDQLNSASEYLVKNAAEVEMEKSMSEIEQSFDDQDSASIASPPPGTSPQDNPPSSGSKRSTAPIISPNIQYSPSNIPSPVSPQSRVQPTGSVLTPGQLATPGSLVQEIGRLHIAIGEKDDTIRKLTEESNEQSKMLSACSDEMIRLHEKYEVLMEENKSLSERLEAALSDLARAAKHAPAKVPLPTQKKSVTRKSPDTKEGSKKETRGHFLGLDHRQRIVMCTRSVLVPTVQNKSCINE